MLRWTPTIVKDERDIWVGSTVGHYQNMGINLEEIYIHMLSQNLVIDYYEKCNNETP